MPAAENELIVLRERTVQLEQQVARLERTVQFLLQHLRLEYVDAPDYGSDTAYIDLLRQNKKMDAIKLYREHTGADFAAATRYIESLKF